jgi:hypothetical protein
MQPKGRRAEPILTAMHTREPNFLRICLYLPIMLNGVLERSIRRTFRWFDLPKMSGEFDSVFVEGDRVAEGFDNLVGGDEREGVAGYSDGVDSVPVRTINDETKGDGNEGGRETYQTPTNSMSASIENVCLNLLAISQVPDLYIEKAKGTC